MDKGNKNLTECIGTIGTNKGLRWLNAARIPADWIEVRIDALLHRGVSPEIILSALKKRSHPALITLRIPAEGGLHSWKKNERSSLFTRLIPFADAIDIELATAPALKSSIQMARKLGKRIIASAHSIQQVPAPLQYKRWIQAFSRSNADIFKIAARIQTLKDLRMLTSLMVSQPDKPWALMGLGPLAPVSRQILIALGSRLAYGYLDIPAAPGQPHVKTLFALKKQLENLEELR